MAHIDRARLDQWLATDGHVFQCAAESEGQACCLAKAEILDIVDGMLAEGPAVVEVQAQPATASGALAPGDEE